MTERNTTTDAGGRLRKMIAETNRNCLMSSWLTLLDTASQVLDELTALTAAAARWNDATLVDREWLEANGFDYHDGLGTWRRQLPNGRFIEVVIDAHDCGVYFAQDGRGAPVHVVRATNSTPTVKTLLHLLTALAGEQPAGVEA